ncbi:hypothetical protein EJB05_14876 [Eragrostis curvula]|uniref:Uncharacterized protein n=1 Tax=Eragrostis curvula TaxID=38414 RepID=A0A5J9VZP4_9POAL|nr:hypothetical protein EJB05_14876 [Eragrostis curvula]
MPLLQRSKKVVPQVEVHDDVPYKDALLQLQAHLVNVSKIQCKSSYNCWFFILSTTRPRELRMRSGFVLEMLQLSNSCFTISCSMSGGTGMDHEDARVQHFGNGHQIDNTVHLQHITCSSLEQCRTSRRPISMESKDRTKVSLLCLASLHEKVLTADNLAKKSWEHEPNCAKGCLKQLHTS